MLKGLSVLFVIRLLVCLIVSLFFRFQFEQLSCSLLVSDIFTVGARERFLKWVNGRILRVNDRNAGINCRSQKEVAGNFLAIMDKTR